MGFVGSHVHLGKVGVVGLLAVLLLVGVGALLSKKSTPSATGVARCVSVSPAAVSAIQAGLKVPGGGRLTYAWAVRSNDYKRAYFVAGFIYGSAPGLVGTSHVGLWATDSVDSAPSAISAVNNLANTYSEWGDGRISEAHFSTSSDGAPEALACAGGSPD
jgi:hypothetical protein